MDKPTNIKIDIYLIPKDLNCFKDIEIEFPIFSIEKNLAIQFHNLLKVFRNRVSLDENIR